MTTFAYLALTLLNFALLFFIVRQRGIASPEGLGVTVLSLLVVSDAVGLVALMALGLDEAHVGARIEDAIRPTAVHIVGMVCLIVGLYSVPRAIVARRTLPVLVLRFVGYGLTLVGLSMKLVAMAIQGVLNPIDYLNRLYEYDTSVRALGFLDQGVSIAILGLAITAITYRNHRLVQAAVLLCAVLVGFFLSTSKSGILIVLLSFFVAGMILDPSGLRYWLRPRWMILALTLFVVGLGLKAQIKYGGFDLLDSSPSAVVEVATTTALLRVGSSGLYEGYANLVNRISAQPSLQFGGAIAESAVQGVIPRFLWRSLFNSEKPEHPFKAKGELINTDFIVDEYGNDAPTLVGFAFADFGLISVVAYLFLGGVLLGLVRRMADLRPESMPVTVAYIMFILSFAPSFPESGFLNFFYYLALAAAVGMLVSTLIFARNVIVLAIQAPVEAGGI